MSKRGNFGKPYRRPPAGWPKALPPYSSVYAHKNPALNGLAKFVNTTSITLQENQVGRPMTRAAIASGPCEDQLENGLPKKTWIGLDVDQFLTSDLPTMNQFTQRGTNDKGNKCRLRGGKWVQAIRHWHGMFGFLSHDGSAWNDVVCTDPTRTHESPQLTPGQTKYLTLTLTGSLYSFVPGVVSPTDSSPGPGYVQYDTTFSQTIDVDPLSGKITISNQNPVTETGLFPGWASHTGLESFFFLLTSPQLITSDYFRNTAMGGAPSYYPLPDPVVTFSASDTAVAFTLYSDDYNLITGTNHGGYQRTYSMTATLTILNTSATVNTDRDHLLSFWDLTDDNLYPWRTDGIWQIAPLVTRDEYAGDVSPMTGFAFSTVDDLTQPQNSDGSWPQRKWFDPNAYGFTRDGLGNVTGFAQFALTGKIFGMPMPTAFTNSESGLYQAGYTAPAKHDFQNYFDYRAEVWKAVRWWQDGSTPPVISCSPAVNGPYVDFYRWGYGEWLYDAIIRTGAQLPHCATQWTNNWQAMGLSPYAYIDQCDKQTYNLNGQPGPGSDFMTGPGGVMAQKCAEILEILPSYDLSRPAAADKFSYDETHVVCTDAGPPVALFDSDLITPFTSAMAGIWGGPSVGGFYTGCSTSLNSYTNRAELTLTTKVFDVPSDWASISGDTAKAFGKLRLSTAPAILGRMNVVSVADLTASRVLVTGALTCLGLDIPQAETVDLCAADMTVLASAVIPTRIKVWKASTAYSAGTVIIDGNGNLQTSSAGTSGGSAPTWAISGTTTDAGVTWIFAKAGPFTVDTTFTVLTALATIAAAKFIVSHGAASYEWDDNQRKGDFVVYDWLFDYRTPGQAADLTGKVDCGGASITPATNNGFASFHKMQYEKNGTYPAIPYTPCKPLVVCISPNYIEDGIDDFGTNSLTIPFPTTFLFDDRYGARWQMEIEQAQADYLWQNPHTQCGIVSPDRWIMDDGSCIYPDPLNIGGGTDIHYAHFPLIEARVTVPNYGGMTEGDTAPTPPLNFTFNTPVTYPALTSVVYPPGMIGYDPTSGNPSGAFTVWGYIIKIEQSSCSPESCRFNYADAENLLCLYGYVDEPLPPDDPLTGLPGLL